MQIQPAWWLSAAGGPYSQAQAHLRSPCSPATLSPCLRQVKPVLMGASQLLDHWASEARALTSDWAMGLDTNGHAWSGGPHSDAYVAAFADRLDNVRGRAAGGGIGGEGRGHGLCM